MPENHDGEPPSIVNLLRFTSGKYKLTRLILETLAREGPLTRAELGNIVGYSHGECSAALSRLIKPRKTLPKRVYIHSYVYHDDAGPRVYLRAKYALGNNRNARRPTVDPNERFRRYQERQKLKVASIFDLGLSRKKRATKRQQTLGTGCASGRGPLQETQDSANGIQHGEQLGCVPAHSD